MAKSLMSRDKRLVTKNFDSARVFLLALIFAPSARGNPFEKRKSKKVKSENEELKATESL